MRAEARGRRADATGVAAAPHVRVLAVLGTIPLLGQERANIEVLRILRDAGADCLVLTNHEWGHQHVQPALDRLGLRWTTARFPGLLSRGMGWRRWARHLRDTLLCCGDFLRAVREYRPTHVHLANEGHYLALGAALLLVRLPVVFRVGDRPRRHRLLFRLVWRWLIARRTAEFVCNSRYVRRQLLGVGVPPERVRLIYQAPAPRRGPREEAPVPVSVVHALHVAYVGQISADKGVDLLVEAAIALCRVRGDVRFSLAGDHTWRNPFAAELIRRVRAVGLEERIRFLGYLPAGDALLSRSDVHVCPSRQEPSLANVLLEAKQAAVPSVVLDSGGLAEVVEHGIDGYVCPEPTAEALRAGIEYFLDMAPESRRRAGSRARQSLVDHGITPEEFTKRWCGVYGLEPSPDPCPRTAPPALRPSQSARVPRLRAR